MGQRTVRPARPDDYEWIICVCDDWWGRPIAHNLPRLFLDHFHSTSFVTSVDGVDVAFLVGFLSPSQPHIGYIHFIGVHPDHRRDGTARDLYERFFHLASGAGCTEVHAITGVVNTGSIAFHGRMGFEVSDPIEGYHGPGTALVHFRRPVSPAT
jgi:ribosomal protein S18 acetylase RimI-like enzyme